MTIVDATLTISPQMPVWPGDPPARLTVAHHDSGLQVTQLCLGAHTGTRRRTAAPARPRACHRRPQPGSALRRASSRPLHARAARWAGLQACQAERRCLLLRALAL